ncbi:hypothetical protein [Cecembia rubra]|uniref:Uncharacterized protein n=1 Tax=Cecembia rubra TaxID=1485585 RepID=A0A2P8EAB1_9BACT|nr:hypothetical protein [Cecembia rubra]PSL06403.1 hypothetical protein CLV48_102219 [Cecembia rubra]
MKKVFKIASLLVSLLGLSIGVISLYNEFKTKELTLYKVSQDIYASDRYNFFDYSDSLKNNEYLTVMPSKIRLQISSFYPESASISEWIIENTGGLPIKGENGLNPIKIKLPLENKIYLAWMEGSYLGEDQVELDIDTITNTVLIKDFLLNKNDQLWITIAHEFTRAKKENLNPHFLYKDDGITGLRDGEDWDPLNLNKYINLGVFLYGSQIYVFFFFSILLFSIGSFRIIAFKFSNKRKLFELIFVFYLSVSLGTIITGLIFNLPIGIEISTLVTTMTIIYYLRLYFFIKKQEILIYNKS